MIKIPIISSAVSIVTANKTKAILILVAVVCLYITILHIKSLKAEIKLVNAELVYEQTLKNRYMANAENLETLLNKFKKENVYFQKQNKNISDRYSLLDQRYIELLDSDPEGQIDTDPLEVGLELNKDFTTLGNHIACLTGSITCINLSF